ncbi:MAG: hypothetical protein IPO64_07795 [Bacteroidetes bacterium]|jgi:hypothetical protein|nr:hypothetical protein [Bacteroidota bacterium]MBL0078373.1 hypothetical protein [Bacteroidota bacterium]
MELVNASFHNDPDTYFQVCHLVEKKIVDICNKNLGINHLDEGWIIGVCATTKTGCDELSTTIPYITKRKKTVGNTIYFPTSYIINREYPLDKFIPLYFIGLRKILASWNIEEQKFVECEELAKKEILNNPKYFLLEEERFSEKMSDEESERIEKILNSMPEVIKLIKKKGLYQ